MVLGGLTTHGSISYIKVRNFERVTEAAGGGFQLGWMTPKLITISTCIPTLTLSVKRHQQLHFPDEMTLN